MSKDLKTVLGRRQLIKTGLGMVVLSPLGGLSYRSFAQTSPHRFLQIFLTGGWDSALATDPVIGGKSSSGAYDSYYGGHEVKTVPGKDRLKIGAGLIPGINAFKDVPTAFVNGLWVEVTAHDLATQYLLTGTRSLTRTDTYPAFVARMAAASGRFPSHVVLGQVPLGETKVSAPPLQALGVDGIGRMLSPPGVDWGFSDAMRSTMNDLTKTLNDLRYGTDVASQSEILGAWQSADSNLSTLYAGGYGEVLMMTDAIRSRYGVTDDLGIAGKIAGSYLVLKSNVSRYVSLTAGDLDTHSNHHPSQINQLKEFSTALGALVQDLRSTPDPESPGETLMDTTTILVLSEFVRTPNVNKFGGTDHWQSASAILMGRGVKDNTVVGATDAEAKAMGWDGTKGVTFSETSRIIPDQLASAILRHYGYAAEADKVSAAPLGGLFT